MDCTSHQSQQFHDPSYQHDEHHHQHLATGQHQHQRDHHDNQLANDQHQHFVNDFDHHEADTSGSGLTTFPLGVEPAGAVGDPLVYVHDPLLHLAQAPPPMSWIAPAGESYGAQAQDEPVIKQEPLASPPVSPPSMTLRRSARIATTPRRPTPAHAAVGLTSGEDDDDYDDHDDDMDGDDRVADEEKRERRRQQVRDASSRRRAKLKNEDKFLNQRLDELENDTKILHALFPHIAPPPPARF